MLSCADRPVRFAEIGYTFRSRRHGDSKLDVNTAVEYLFLIIDKLTDCIIPTRFTAFALVGAAGVATHLALPQRPPARPPLALPRRADRRHLRSP